MELGGVEGIGGVEGGEVEGIRGGEWKEDEGVREKVWKEDGQATVRLENQKTLELDRY